MDRNDNGRVGSTRIYGEERRARGKVVDRLSCVFETRRCFERESVAEEIGDATHALDRDLFLRGQPYREAVCAGPCDFAVAARDMAFLLLSMKEIMKQGIDASH